MGCAGNSEIHTPNLDRLAAGGIEYLKGQPMYTDFLADAGYVYGLSGKWHLGNSHKAQASYSYWNVHANAGFFNIFALAKDRF